jgi:ribosome-associated protein
MLIDKPSTLWSKTLTKEKLAPKKAAKRTKKADNKADELADFILDILDTQSAEDIVKLDLRGKSSIADFMLVASGRSNRHVGALADYVKKGLTERGEDKLGIEGLEQCDWVLIDAGDVIMHLFRPEVREFYNLEKMWSVPSLHASADELEAMASSDT